MHKIPKKKLYIGIGVVVLGALVYSFILHSMYSNLNLPEGGNSNTLPSSSPASTKKSSTKAPLSATKSYLDALKVYKATGYYFQFSGCHGLPGSLTLKRGSKFMLDNRDGKARKLVIEGGQSFNVSAYGFAVATAPNTLGTHYITCDGGGAAYISVQK